jgi:hypothetical protein
MIKYCQRQEEHLLTIRVEGDGEQRNNQIKKTYIKSRGSIFMETNHRLMNAVGHYMQPQQIF